MFSHLFTPLPSRTSPLHHHLHFLIKLLSLRVTSPRIRNEQSLSSSFPFLVSYALAPYPLTSIAGAISTPHVFLFNLFFFFFFFFFLCLLSVGPISNSLLYQCEFLRDHSYCYIYFFKQIFIIKVILFSNIISHYFSLKPLNIIFDQILF